MPRPERKKTPSMREQAIGLAALLVLMLVGAGIYAGGSTIWSLSQRGSVEDVAGVEGAEETKDAKGTKGAEGAEEGEESVVVAHTPLPEEVRGIYWTASTGGSQRGQQLLAYMKDSGLNAVVLDVKMDNGQLAFVPEDPSMKKYVMDRPALDELDALLAQLHEEGMYRIARVAVMRDGAMAAQNPHAALRWPGGSMWTDNTGARWVDPAAPEVAEYAVALGRELHARGFDEIQYDYVRFASDGRISSIRYPAYNPQEQTKVEAMQEFFAAAGGTLKEEGVPVSFDVFGMTFENTHDFNIGQRLLDAWPHADFVSPMQYPSHYANGFDGFANPAVHPYPIVKNGLDRGAEMLRQEMGISEETSRPTFRPWLQDFDIGAVYTAARIEAQIKAARDAGASGWMLWNARNVYQPAEYVGGSSE